jgi:hypothetical protein
MEKYAKLTGMSDDELIGLFDAIGGTYSPNPQWYLDELTRRRTDRASDALKRLTRTLTKLTWLIAVLTAIGVAASLIAAFK